MENIDITEKLELGLNAVIEKNVEEKDSAENFGNIGVNVFATPALISLIEVAAKSAVGLHLPNGYATVGTKIDVAHLAATPIGMKVNASATLIGISGKKLTFKVEVYDEVDKIGEGTHERFIINTDKFMEKVNKKAGQ